MSPSDAAKYTRMERVVTVALPEPSPPQQFRRKGVGGTAQGPGVSESPGPSSKMAADGRSGLLPALFKKSYQDLMYIYSFF